MINRNNKVIRTRVIPMVLILPILCFALHGCGSAGQTAEKLQKVSENGVSIEVPAQWKIENDDEATDGLINVESDGFKALFQVGLDLHPLSACGTTPQSVLDYWEQCGYVFDGDPEKLDNIGDALVYQVKIEQDSGWLAFGKIAMFSDMSSGVLVYCPTEVYEKHAREIQEVLDTFDVLDPDEPTFAETSAESSSDSSSSASTESKTTDPTKAQPHKAGSYRVGTDIPAGEYKINCSGSHGYYCVYPDTTKADILDNGNFTSCTYVTVSDGQLLEVSGATFIEIANAEPTTTISGEGTFKVGFDLPAGQYEVTTIGSGTGYYAILADDNATSRDIINNDNFENNSFISLSDGQFLEISRASIKSAA